MTTYSTEASIRIMLPGLRDNSTTTDIISQYNSRVAGKIDAYVFNRYDPIGWTSSASTPQLIQQISDALVAKNTMKSLFTSDGQNRNDWVGTLAEEALEDLEKIRKGELPLTLNGAEASGRTVEIDATRKEFTPVFDMDNDLSDVVDPDLLDDINNDRA